MSGMIPARAMTEQDIQDGLVDGVAIVGDEKSILFHVVRDTDHGNTTGITYYGITLIDNDGVGTPIMGLGVLTNEAAYQEVIRVVARVARRRGDDDQD